MRSYLVTFCFLIPLSGNVFAQPLAPITWQASRVLVAQNGNFVPQTVCPHGDSIVVSEAFQGRGQFDAATITGNYGNTWSSPHIFPDTSIQTNAAGAYGVAFLSDGIYCNAVSSYLTGMGFYRTTNLGLTWTPPCTLYSNPRPRFQNGDTIFYNVNSFRGDTTDHLVYTVDPCHFSVPWQPPSPFQTSWGFLPTESMGRIHLAQRTVYNAPGYPGWNVYYTHGAPWNSTWAPSIRINPTIPYAQEINIDFDQEGNGCILNMVDFMYGGWCSVVVNMTHDNGDTWSNYRLLSPGESVSWISHMSLNHWGHFGVASWIDTTHDVGIDSVGSWLAFSANRGRSWYPSHQVNHPMTSVLDNTMLQSSVDIRPTYIRLYDIRNSDLFRAYVTEGILHPDTLAPVISQADTISAPVLPSTTLSFSANATDNDSLWLLDLIIMRVGSVDSVVIPFVRDSSSNHYTAQWQTPADTGTFTYYYRAEDMWENVTITPTDTFWVGAVSVPEKNLLPNTPSLSVYPSPFNSTVTLRYKIAKPGQTRYAIYSSDGRELYHNTLGMQSVGQHTASWNGKNQAGIAVSSGVYFVRFESGEFRVVKKVVLVK